jgi:hypothetical protein
VSLYEERAARNEALFREVNEELERLAREHSRDPAEPLHLVCECVDADCNDRISVPTHVYEQVRSDARRFLVKPGHEVVNVEHIVLETDDYMVVEKDTPTTARVAERTDPRAPRSP